MTQSYLILGEISAANKKTREILKSLNSQAKPNSPDLTIVTPAKKVTSIDQVREVKRTIYQKPLREPFKIVIFQEAGSLNKEAQNALLKILEEPPEKAIIFLLTRDKSSLLPTVLSRLTTVWTNQKPESVGDLLIENTEDELLKLIPAISDPSSWLDEQMILLARELKRQVQKGQNSQKTQAALVLCKEAKRMIDANVSPNFVLANLFIHL